MIGNPGGGKVEDTTLNIKKKEKGDTMIQGRRKETRKERRRWRKKRRTCWR